MLETHTPKTSRQKMAAYRQRQKAKGLRLIQLWVPDVRDPKFIRQLRKEARLIARHGKEEKRTLDFIERTMDYREWK